jgi:hypothetical protein
MQRLEERTASLYNCFGGNGMTPEERLDRIEQDIDKQNEAIRGLIVVGRTCLDSIKEMGERHEKDHNRLIAEIDKVRELQLSTEEKLNILISEVDRIIRNRNNKPPER